MVKLVRREVLLFKIETTYNTDAVPVEGVDALLVENLSHSLEGLRMVERAPIDGSIAKKQSVYGGTLMSVTFDMEIKGSGAAGTAPESGAPLRGCGMGETIVASTSVAYSPVSSSHESATIYFYEDGSLYKLTGCRGSVSGALETGEFGKFSFTFTGHLASKTDVSLPSPSYDSTLPAPLINVPFTIGGYAAVINNLSFDLGIELATPPSISATDGYSTVLITGRDVNGSFDPEATLVADQDFLGDLQSSATNALACGVIGSVAGNRYRIDMPAVSYRELSPGDRDSLRTYEIGYGASESTTDDEITILFT